MIQLTEQELKKRARAIRLVLSDNDGVMTDTGVYYSDSGEVMKRFSIRDGMGVERLRNIGIETAIITGETSGSVKARAEKLKMKFLYLGVKDKATLLDSILTDTGCQIHEIAYIGDDVNDIDIINRISPVGITACPADAMPVIKPLVHFHTTAPAGNGAFRDFAEWLIRLRQGI